MKINYPSDLRDKECQEIQELFIFKQSLRVRKRHILVDTQGLLLTANITAASMSDKQGFCQLLEKREQLFSCVKKVWEDHGY